MDAYARVLAEPGSPAARKALLAEWQAKADPRAALLANQLAYGEHIARGSRGSREAQELLKAIHLAVAHDGKRLYSALAGLVTALEFHRGLPAGVTLPGARFAEVAPRLFALAPIQHVTLTSPIGPVDALFGSPALLRLVSLNIPKVGAELGDAGAVSLARSPHAANLRWISLPEDAIGEAGVEALAASPYLDRVRYLGLAGNPADPTPYVHEFEGVYTTGRPELAAELERTYGERPWLSEPSEPASWPPDRDALAITP